MPTSPSDEVDAATGDWVTASRTLTLSAPGECRVVGLNSLQTRHHQDSGDKGQSKILGLLNRVVNFFDQCSGSILSRRHPPSPRVPCRDCNLTVLASITDSLSLLEHSGVGRLAFSRGCPAEGMAVGRSDGAERPGEIGAPFGSAWTFGRLRRPARAAEPGRSWRKGEEEPVSTYWQNGLWCRATLSPAK